MTIEFPGPVSKVKSWVKICSPCHAEANMSYGNTAEDEEGNQARERQKPVEDIATSFLVKIAGECVSSGIKLVEADKTHMNAKHPKRS